MKIGFLTYMNIENLCTGLDTMYNCEFVFKICIINIAISQAINLEVKDEVDVIIASNPSADAIKDHINVPVISLNIRNHNIVEALYKATREKNNISFIDMKGSGQYYDLVNSFKLFEAKITHYRLTDIIDTPILIKELQHKEFDTVVTTAKCMESQSDKAGLKTIFVMPTLSDLIEYIELAINVVNEKKKHIITSQWIKHAINDTVFGCIGINQYDNQIEFMNRLAFDFLNLNEASFYKYQRNLDELRDYSDLFDKVYKMSSGSQMINEGGNNYFIEKDYIYEKQQCLGSFIKIAESSKIEKVDIKMRQKRAESTLYAKNTFNDIIGTSEIIKSTIRTSKQIAKTDFRILIEGESGVGKELFAQSIHNYSPRRNKPFVAINCSAITPNLLESELFGYEEGTFTGGLKGGKQGLFEIAHTGTLFLDEIADMSIELQPKILRVLQENTIRRIGGSKNIYVNVRIISATNKNLEREVKLKNFREDLYYRLNELNVRIPTLHERKQDIPVIAEKIAQDISRENLRDFSIPDEKMELLTHYSWPGNVRQLQNFITKMFILCEDDLSLAFFEDAINDLISTNNNLEYNSSYNKEPDPYTVTIKIGTMKEMENSIIAQLYNRFEKDKKKLEYILQISSTTLWRRLKECFD